MSDLRSLAHLEEQLGERRWGVLINPTNTGKVKRLLDDIDDAEKSEKAKKFPVCKIVTLGLYKDIDSYRNVMESDNHKVGIYADRLLYKTDVSQTEVKLELVIASGYDLGFTSKATREAIYAVALEEFGLYKCPAETGPALRVAYKVQPIGESLLIGMDPIADSDGDLHVFDVGRGGDGVSWLFSDYGGPDGRWSPAVRWVFGRRK